MKRFVVLLAALVLTLCCLFLVACGEDPATSGDVEQTTAPDTTTEAKDLQFLVNGEFASAYPKPALPEKVYTFTPPKKSCDLLTLVSAQGVLAKTSSDRVLIQYDNTHKLYTNAIKSVYGETTTVSSGSTLWLFLKNHASNFKGYILTDLGDESINVATSLAGIMDALIVTTDNKESAAMIGLSELIDVTDKDDSWLRKSEYFAQLNKDVAVMVNSENPNVLRDYAIFCGAYAFPDTDTSSLFLMNRLNYLNDNFVILGWNSKIGENGTVKAISTINGSLIPADFANNVATLASFPLVFAEQKTDVAISDGKGKHTVCLVMSDGDNLQWALKDFILSNKWYASSKRGDFPIAWGIPTSLADLGAPALIHLYKDMTPTDEFMLQLSGLGYTYPSYWKNKDALAETQKQIIDLMKRTDTSVFEILDDVKLTQDVVDKYYSGYFADDQVDGIFYIDYTRYDSVGGKIFWVNGKPLVSARYDLWSELDTIENIANKVNNAPTDPTSEDSYSFIILHAWSGLDSNGNFVSGENSMDAVAKMVSLFDEDVEIVTPSQFVDRLTENVQPK